MGWRRRRRARHSKPSNTKPWPGRAVRRQGSEQAPARQAGRHGMASPAPARGSRRRRGRWRPFPSPRTRAAAPSRSAGPGPPTGSDGRPRSGGAASTGARNWTTGSAPARPPGHPAARQPTRPSGRPPRRVHQNHATNRTAARQSRDLRADFRSQTDGSWRNSGARGREREIKSEREKERLSWPWAGRTHARSSADGCTHAPQQSVGTVRRYVHVLAQRDQLIGARKHTRRHTREGARRASTKVASQ